jgi:hypothetical protein
MHLSRTPAYIALVWKRGAVRLSRTWPFHLTLHRRRRVPIRCPHPGGRTSVTGLCVSCTLLALDRHHSHRLVQIRDRWRLFLLRFR